MRSAYPTIRDLGADLLAISTESIEDVQLAETTVDLPFMLLSDPQHSTVQRYGLLHIDQTERRPLARPSSFLIDARGIIRFAYVGEHPRDRVAIGSLLLAIERLASES